MHLLPGKPAPELLVRDMSRPKPILWLFAKYFLQRTLFGQTPFHWFCKMIWFFSILYVLTFWPETCRGRSPFYGFLQRLSFATQPLQQISAKYIHKNKERNLISTGNQNANSHWCWKIRNQWFANFCPRQLCKHKINVKRKESHWRHHHRHCWCCHHCYCLWCLHCHCLWWSWRWNWGGKVARPSLWWRPFLISWWVSSINFK